MGLRVEQRLQEKGGPTGLLGSLGPHPWLFEAAGEPNHHPRWLATGVAGSGVLGPPTLALAQRAHRAGRILTTSEVLGSFPWLFVPILASRIAAHRKARHQHIEDASKGIVSRARGVSGAASTSEKPDSRRAKSSARARRRPHQEEAALVTAVLKHRAAPLAGAQPPMARPQHIMDTIRPLEPVSWSSVPLALRITFPDASSHALRLTLRRRWLPHGVQQFASDGSPVYPQVTGSDALHCF